MSHKTRKQCKFCKTMIEEPQFWDMHMWVVCEPCKENKMPEKLQEMRLKVAKAVGSWGLEFIEALAQRQ